MDMILNKNLSQKNDVQGADEPWKQEVNILMEEHLRAPWPEVDTDEEWWAGVSTDSPVEEESEHHLKQQ